MRTFVRFWRAAAVLTVAGLVAFMSTNIPPRTAAASGGVTVDQSASALGPTPHSVSVTNSTPELAVAYVSVNGPGSGGQTLTSVTTTGLTWHFLERENAQNGDTEIWYTTTAGANFSAKATASETTLDGGGTTNLDIVVQTYANASGVGASQVASGSSGAQSVTLTPTSTGGLVTGVGFDWTNDVARTVPSGQTSIMQHLDTTNGDTFWAQQANASTTAGTPVTVNDTAPTADVWDYAAVEVAASGGGGTTTTTMPTTTTTTSGGGGGNLLPGCVEWTNGPSCQFGSQDSIEYGSPNVDGITSVQTALKNGLAGGLFRTWMYNGDGDSADETRVQTAVNAGMVPMVMLGSPGATTWLKHIVTLFDGSDGYPQVNIYEFGNEPDNSNNGTSIAQMVSQWNAIIPTLRAINPSAVFGGPAVQYPTSSDGSQGSYPSDIAYFLAKTAASGNRADFISYHHYACTGYTSKSACISDTPGTITTGYDDVLGWENTYYGGTIPTGISEWNYDPGTSTLGNFASDNSFVYNWTETMQQTVINDGMAFSNQFTSLNYSGYGDLDMFCDSSPYKAKPQYYGLVAEGEANGSGSTVTATPDPFTSC